MRSLRMSLPMLPGRRDLAAMRQDPARDLLCGVTVAIVALPLALAFGASSGVGARAGLATAVVAGALAALFGGSNLQVSGPTGAMTVVLVPIVHRFGPRGAFMVGLMAGAVLLVLAAARIGRYARFLPTPVIEGFTAGIAVVIALQQVPAVLGIGGLHGDKVWRVAAEAVARFAAHPACAPVLMALTVTVALLVGARLRPGIPFSLPVVAVVTLAADLAGVHVARVGNLPAGLPAPSLAFFDPAALEELLPSALAVAALAALASLLCASAADAMSVRERHDPDRELFGQGLANLITPLFGGVPATADIARTAVNVRAGARSRLAALTHAAILGVVVFAAAPLVGRIPLAALAGVLLATTARMVDVGAVSALARTTRGDGVVMGLTFLVTVALDLVTAVAVGLGAAILLALRAVARTANAEVERVELPGADHSAEERRLLDERIVAYRLDGPLFFAAASDFLRRLSEVTDVRVVILRMSRVSTIDATGARLLRNAIRALDNRGIAVLASGVRPGHTEVLTVMGGLEGNVFLDTPEAIAHARALLASAPAAVPAVAARPSVAPT
ncbi:SulP family inorganic anion transporter [Actinomadura barringtoniae]|uniref:SulP family inorganic anion transporter n=1 Tax=Actinomadura barringtoniae TaxID=1427535 RepID=A0A939PHE9_9ACTN|nr:SulP family inorganic anion transporter [Actinomadura barringtoniae]MBO2452741.1 SulP family inorganic anion transporter [Actinomadura barringtoniae]